MGGILSPDTVRGLQGLMRRNGLPDTCVLQTRTTASDGAGGETVTYPEGSALPCRLMPAGLAMDEQGIGGRETATQRWELYLDPADAGTLTADDRVRLTSLNGVTVSRLFEVVDGGGRSDEAVRTFNLLELT